MAAKSEKLPVLTVLLNKWLLGKKALFSLNPDNLQLHFLGLGALLVSRRKRSRAIEPVGLHLPKDRNPPLIR